MASLLIHLCSVQLLPKPIRNQEQHGIVRNAVLMASGESLIHIAILTRSERFYIRGCYFIVIPFHSSFVTEEFMTALHERLNRQGRLMM